MRTHHLWVRDQGEKHEKVAAAKLCKVLVALRQRLVVTAVASAACAEGKLSHNKSVLRGTQAGGDVRLLPPDCQAPKVDGKIATANTNGNRPSKNNGGKQRHYDSQYQGMEDDSRGFHVSIPFDGGSRFTTKIRFNRFIQKIRSVSVPPSAWFPSKVRLQRSVAPKLPGADSRWRDEKKCWQLTPSRVNEQQYTQENVHVQPNADK